jgi:DNA-binding MarR family transcriptional regulator
MGRVFACLMKEAGLGDIGSGEGSVLYILWRSGPLRQGVLAAKAGIDKSTLALTLSRMERKGWVTRCPDPDDARAALVSISGTAAARAPAFESVSRKMNELFYDGLADAEIDAFESTLERILENLGRG